MKHSVEFGQVKTLKPQRNINIIVDRSNLTEDTIMASLKSSLTLRP